MASEARADSADAPSHGARTLLGLVENDRYCDECGFNLRGQHVFRDSATRLVLARCSECGTLHPANLLTTNARGAWFKRLAGVLLLVWMLVLVWLFFMSGIAEIAVQIATVEELDLDKPTSDIPELIARNAFPLAWFAIISFVLPAVGLTLLTVAAHHWRKWGYIVAAVVLPVIPALVTRAVALDEFPDTMHRAEPFFWAHTGLQVLGGLFGATMGRPMARLAASVFLPPRARQALTFLWLADAKPPPALKRAGEGAAH